jgi:hypothetical protein
MIAPPSPFHNISLVFKPVPKLQGHKLLRKKCPKREKKESGIRYAKIQLGK